MYVAWRPNETAGSVVAHGRAGVGMAGRFWASGTVPAAGLDEGNDFFDLVSTPVALG